MVMEFLDSSISLQKKLDLKYRAKNGIFFTPKSLRDIVFSHIDIQPQSILEPSCGSGEFLVDCAEKFPQAEITGIEKDVFLAREAQKNAPTTKVYTQDFLAFQGGKFDLIIGNPPFVQTKKSYDETFTGRSNLYIDFVHKSIRHHLNENGVLAMILPSTIQNGHFSQSVRNLIFTLTVTHFQIIRDHTFKDTKAGVSILVLKNCPGHNSRYLFDGLLVENSKFMYDVTYGRKKLKDYNVTVRYGMMTSTLKEYFSKNPDDTPFVLKNDLARENINFCEKTRLFINKKNIKSHSGRCILLLRSDGVVMGSEYKLMFSFFESDKFLFDICLVGIFGPDIDKIYKSLRDTRTTRFLANLCGSGRLTKNIISNLPIFE